VIITTLPNGNLLLTAEPTDTLESERGYWQVMEDLFEPYWCNGSYQHFDAGNANPFVGLTEAPCIAERMYYDDEGNASIDGRLWYFGDYMIRDDLQELQTHGRVEYQLVT
jgi:hypothetical protein